MFLSFSRPNVDAEQCSRSSLTTPRHVQDILGDGNCFFRAVSFSLTNSEDFHYILRRAVCQHMIKNNDLFESFLNDEQSIDDHLQGSKMSQEGTWATEVEIFATAHLLNTDIYIHSLQDVGLDFQLMMWNNLSRPELVQFI